VTKVVGVFIAFFVRRFIGKVLDFVLIFLSDSGIKNQEFNDAAKKAFIMNKLEILDY
jgi:hypothetical protein